MQNTKEAPKKTMRDAMLAEIMNQMDRGEKVFLLSADFGAPALDAIRAKHPKKFLNVGIAEQNLVNVAAGLALEGFVVYGYAIAPFITMRCCEQIRVNLAILSQVRPMNVNLIGVGAGFSYEVSGPTHHCLEDISIMRTFPNLSVISPSDWTMAGALASHCFENCYPKYLRFDSKPLPQIHEKVSDKDLKNGFVNLRDGQNVCLVSTGFMTHKTIEVCKALENEGINVGHIDLFMLKTLDEKALCQILSRYKRVISLEEGFVSKGGLDSMLSDLILRNHLNVKFKAMGLQDKYIFHIGHRDDLHDQNNIGVKNIISEARMGA